MDFCRVRCERGVSVLARHFAANELEGTWPGPGGPAQYPGTGMCPGQKCTRHTIDVNISAYDLASSYLAPFRSSVVDGGALGIMCSYNAINGYPSCANKWLLGKLRKDMGLQISNVHSIWLEFVLSFAIEHEVPFDLSHDSRTLRARTPNC